MYRVYVPRFRFETWLGVAGRGVAVQGVAWWGVAPARSPGAGRGSIVLYARVVFATAASKCFLCAYYCDSCLNFARSAAAAFVASVVAAATTAAAAAGAGRDLRGERRAGNALLLSTSRLLFSLPPYSYPCPTPSSPRLHPPQ